LNKNASNQTTPGFPSAKKEKKRKETSGVLPAAERFPSRREKKETFGENRSEKNQKATAKADTAG